MREYRIRAYFKDVYTDRSYKGKVFNTLKEAEDTFQEAKEYYNSRPYADKLIKVQIESRKVEAWKEEKYSSEDYKTLESNKTLKQLASEYVESGENAIIEVEWWWSSYRSWREYFNFPEVNIAEDYGNKTELEPEYCFKGTAEEFLNYCSEYSSVGAIRGKECEQFSIEDYSDYKGNKGLVVFAKYVEETE